MKSEGEETITKNYSNGLYSGIEWRRVSVGGLDLIFNDLFEILRDGMGKDEMNVFSLTIILD